MVASGVAMPVREKGILFLFILLVLVTSFFSSEWSKWLQAIVLIFSFLFAFLVLRRLSPGTAAVSWRTVLRHPHTYLVGWLGIGAIGIIFSVNWYGSLSYWFLMVAYMLLYFSAYVFFRHWRQIQWLSYGLVGIGVIGAIAGLALYLNQSADRLNGFLFNANAISSFFIILIPLAIVLWLQAATRRSKIVWGIGLLFLFVALLLTYSYTAWVSLVLPLYLLLRQYRRQLFNRTAIAVVCVMIVVGIGALIGFRYAQSRDFSTALKIHQTISFTHFISSFSQRWYFAVSAVRMGVDHLAIGSGLNTYQDVYARYAETVIEQPRYAHNYYAQAFAELGVFGVAAFVVFIILVTRSAISTIRREPDEQRKGILLGLALGTLASALHSFFDFGWHFAVVFILFWLMLGVLMAWRRNQQTDTTVQETSAPALPPRGRAMAVLASAGVMVVAFIVLCRGMTVFLGAYSFDTAERQAARGEFESAFVSYEQGLRLDPDPAVFSHYAGLMVTNLLFADTEKKAGIETRLQLMTQSLPENYRAFWMLGRLHIAQQQYDQAIQPLTRAIELNPLFLPDIHYDLAYAFYSLGKYDEAGDVARAILDVYYPGIQTSNLNLPSQLAALNFLLGEIAKAEGDRVRAAYYYGESLHHDAGFQPAVTALQSLSGNQ